MIKKWVYFILKLFVLFGSFSTLGIQGQDSILQELQGAWILFKDDDNPIGLPVREILYIYEDGQVIVEGDSRIRGFFQVQNQRMEQTLSFSGEEVTIDREFQIKDHVLQFKNNRSGFAYYRKTRRTLPAFRPEHWPFLKEGPFSLTCSKYWKIMREKVPNLEENQQILIRSPRERKGVLILKITDLQEPSPKQIEQIMNLIIKQVLSDKKVPELTFKKGNLYGVDALITAFNVANDDTTFQTLGTRHGDNLVVLFTWAKQDRLNEIYRIIQSLKVDGLSIGSGV